MVYLDNIKKKKQIIQILSHVPLMIIFLHKDNKINEHR